MLHPGSCFNPPETISCYSSRPFRLGVFSSISSTLILLFFSYSPHPLDWSNSWYSYHLRFHGIIASLLNVFLIVSLICYSCLPLYLFSSPSFVLGILDNLLFSYSHSLPCCCKPRMFISLVLCYPVIISSFFCAIFEDLLIIIFVDLSNQKDDKINFAYLLCIYNLHLDNSILGKSSMSLSLD